MTRIISGAFGGRRLATPDGADTRPTADRVREGLFSRLAHLDLLDGARVLDLYAGSGALGLEALSRGAAHLVAVESDRRAAQVTQANVRDLQVGDRATVVADTVERFLLGAAYRPESGFDLVLLDPPYPLAEDRLADLLALLVVHDWLGTEAHVVVERSARSPEPRWPAGLRLEAERRYGETKVWFAQIPGPDEIA